MLAANSSSLVWRASNTGDCRQRATLEVSTNGGKAWRRIDAGLRSIVRLKAYGGDSVFAVGADRDCRAAVIRVSDPQTAPSRDDELLASTWYRVPARPDVVHAPGGRTSRPCGSQLADLAGLGTYRATALCSDGRVRTITRGRSWQTVRTTPGTLSVNADDTQFVALARRDGCAGLVVHRFDATGDGLSAGSGRCDQGSDQSPTAVALAGDRTWVWRPGSTTLVSG